MATDVARSGDAHYEEGVAFQPQHFSRQPAYVVDGAFDWRLSKVVNACCKRHSADTGMGTRRELSPDIPPVFNTHKYEPAGGVR